MKDSWGLIRVFEHEVLWSRFEGVAFRIKICSDSEFGCKVVQA